MSTQKQTAIAIIRTLGAAGYEALLAGGCVRDMLLDTTPKDYDVATNATPEQICNLYPSAQTVGAHFGVVIVRTKGHLVEVATFRNDGHYSDGRHPDDVTFTTAIEDAKRRDFTINGLFYDPIHERVIDHVGGVRDIEDRLIQAIGNPEQRFEEDHLRMLRAVRFAARLDFEIEQETFEAIYNRADKISVVSQERIRDELEKILVNPHRPRGFRLLADTNLLMSLWANPHWSTLLVEQAFKALSELPSQASFTLAFSTMLHAHPIEHTKASCRSLRLSNADTRAVVWLLESLEAIQRQQVNTLADLKLLMASTHFDDLCTLVQATDLATGSGHTRWQEIRDRAHQIPSDEVQPERLINGDDLLGMGLQQGPRFKEILDTLYYRQLNLDLQDREQALQEAQSMVDGVD